MNNLVLITGSAGFIGYHTAQALLARGISVAGIDNLNSYYSPALKQARLDKLRAHPGYQHHTFDLSETQKVQALFESLKPKRVINLAAQVGVRYSMEAPKAYIDSNIDAFLNILEACRHWPVEHLVYASSSAVYGANEQVPFSTVHPTERPISLYAATKKANELMAHAYAYNFGIPVTGLRFFTVYGPWGRPDMAYFRFADSIMKGKPIQLYNQGNMQRDFTYVEDIVRGILAVLEVAPKGELPYAVHNIGNTNPVGLRDFVALLEKYLGRQAIIEYQPLQPGDMVSTWADVSSLHSATGYVPSVPLEQGLEQFCRWFLEWRPAG